MVSSEEEENQAAALSEFAAKLMNQAGGGASSSDASLLESKLGGLDGLVNALLPKLWLPPSDDGSDDNIALLILVHLVETYPKKYMPLVASAIRGDVEQKFNTAGMDIDTPGNEQPYVVSDALLLALAKLLVAPNSDTQTGIATDAHAALLQLCRWDNFNYHKSTTCLTLFHHLDTIWDYLLEQQKDKLRESSTAQMRIAAIMIDGCLLGGKEMSIALSENLMDKLLHIALDYPNEDPLLQMTALDQLERLTIQNKDHPITRERAEFLLGNDNLHQGLLYLVGSPYPNESSSSDIEFDPINGWAALRLLTEISRVGISSSNSIAEVTRHQFLSLLGCFHNALNELVPRGEAERLTYIYAVSSLVASCATSKTNEEMSKLILQDTTLLNGWLSLLSRSSQPKLKSAVLSSLSQVIEPGMWREGEEEISVRPSDYTALTLYHAFGEANDQKDPTECLLLSAKSPFVEERLGALNVFRAMVTRPSCVRMLLMYRGADDSTNFVDWLLNQDNESTNEGRQAKYQIVESLLSGDNNIEGLIPAPAFRELKLWKSRGPAHITTIPWDLATE